uniref:Uncharacterized protein n=1 Tax=Arundo donax TaxID=35708 RepID=A0A0A9E990_ARUDO
MHCSGHDLFHGNSWLPSPLCTPSPASTGSP